MAASVGLRMKPSFHSRTAAVLICTCGCLLLGASAIEAQVPSPGPPAPPGSKTLLKADAPRAKVNVTELTVIASRFFASEFRAQVFKFPKIVKGPVVTMPRNRQTQPPSQTNNIPTVNPKQTQSPSQIKDIPTVTPKATESPLQLSKIPEALDDGVKLTLIPATAAKLLEGCDPGWAAPPPGGLIGSDGCPVFTTSMYTPTSTDTLFPGRTVAVTKFASPGDPWSGRAVDVFSFQGLAPGFWVSGFQIETQDLSGAMLPMCRDQLKAMTDSNPLLKAFIRGDPWAYPPSSKPVTTWDQTARTLSVWVPAWTCAIYYYDTNGWWGPIGWVPWGFGTGAADYAVTVWATGPKGKGPWGGKIVRVR